MNIKYIVIHCADTPNEKEFDAADIHDWHKQRGFDGIGYHRVIKRNGAIENGRPDFWAGAHVKGHNSESLGVCLVGRDKFTDDQFASLTDIVTEWKNDNPEAKVVGHYQLDESKTCPNFNVTEWWYGV